MEPLELQSKSLEELKTMAKSANVKAFSKMKKRELVAALSPIEPVECCDVGGVCPILPPAEGCKGGVCPIEVKKPRKPRTKKVERSASINSEDSADLADFLKKITKQQLMPSAEKLSILNAAKLNKKDLFDEIIEKTIALKLEEIAGC